MYSSIYIYILPITDISGIGGTCVVWMMKIMKPMSHYLYTQLREWLFVVGYALCFGSVLAKMWRIYYIFQNPTAKKNVGLLVIYQCNHSVISFCCR